MQGLLMSVGDTVGTPESFLRLWRNECMRVLHDRLISVEDKLLLTERLAMLVEGKFPSFAASVLASPILYGDFRNAATGLGEGIVEGKAAASGPIRMYEDLGDFATIKPMFEELLRLFNKKRQPMNLVFFEDALEHLTRIHRTMRLPQVCCVG